MPKLIAQLIAAQEEQRQAALEEEASMSFGSESLNAGAELDDEVLLPHFEEPETPAMEEALNQVVALENAINDLGYLIDAIESTGGMCKSYALEGEKILPGFGEGLPLGYYTEKPSATRLKVAMEELSAGVWKLIAAGIFMVIFLIADYMYWLATGKNREKTEKPQASDTDKWARLSDQSSKDAQQYSRQADEAIKRHKEAAASNPKSLHNTAEVIQKAEGLLHSHPVVVRNNDGQEKECHSFQDVIDHVFTDEERYSRAKRFLQTGDPMFHDIVNNGPYSGVIVEVGSKIGAINQSLHAKIGVLDMVARSDLNSHETSTQLKNSLAMKIIDRPVEIVVAGQKVTLREASHSLSVLRQDVMRADAKNALKFDNMFESLARSYEKKNVAAIIGAVGESTDMIMELEKRLRKLAGITRDLATDGRPGAVSQDIAPFLRQVIANTGQDIAGFGMVAHQLKMFISTLEHITVEVTGFAKEVVRKVVAEMRHSGQEVPEAWQQVVKDIEEEMRSVSRAWFSMKH